MMQAELFLITCC